MDHTRFDVLTRTISSRRAAGGIITSAVAGLLGLTQVHDAGAVRCPKGKKRCGKKCIPTRGCCKSAQCTPKGSGKVCKRNRCVCPTGTRLCQNRCRPRTAACPPRPDASCQPGGGIIRAYSWFDRIAQSFTEPNGGRLTAVDLWLCNESAMTVGVYELWLTGMEAATGAPGGDPLAKIQLSSDSVSDVNPGWVRFDFEVPPVLQPGQQYALVLSMLGGTGTAGWITERRTGNPCPGGTFFVQSGGMFTPLLDSDIPYRTFVTT